MKISGGWMRFLKPSLILLMSFAGTAVVHAQDCKPTPPGALEPGHGRLIPGQVQISSAIVASRSLKSKVDPTFPDASGVSPQQGFLELEVVIAKDGTVKSAHATCGPKPLRKAAENAVMLWTYRVYIIQGEPREVVTNVFVPYDLTAAGSIPSETKAL